MAKRKAKTKAVSIDPYIVQLHAAQANPQYREVCEFLHDMQRKVVAARVRSGEHLDEMKEACRLAESIKESVVLGNISLAIEQAFFMGVSARAIADWPAVTMYINRDSGKKASDTRRKVKSDANADKARKAIEMLLREGKSATEAKQIVAKKLGLKSIRSVERYCRET